MQMPGGVPGGMVRVGIERDIRRELKPFVENSKNRRIILQVFKQSAVFHFSVF